MSNYENLTTPSYSERRVINILNLVVDTQEFIKMYNDHPQEAFSFWNRVQNEFEVSFGYPKQEFDALSWEADMTLGISPWLREEAHVG